MVQAVEIYSATYQRPAGGLFSAELGWDGAGVRHDLYLDHNGDTDATALKYIRTDSSQQRTTETWTAPAGVDGHPMKIDTVAAPAINIGTGQTRGDLTTLVTVHGPAAPDPAHPGQYIGRVTKIIMVWWERVWAPRTDGLEFREARNGVMPPAQPSVDFTLQQVIDGVHASLQQDFTRVINNMKQKAAAALLEAHVITETDFNDGEHGGSATVYGQLVNTSFTGALGALHAQGDSAVMSKTQLPALPMKVPVAHKIATPETEAEVKPKRGKDCEDGA